MSFRTPTDVNLEDLQRYVESICRLAHKHEIQYWLDAPGTDDQKLRSILVSARDALALVKELRS